MIYFVNILSFHVVLFFSKVGLKLFKLRNGIILSGHHGMVPLDVLKLDVIGLVLDTCSKVRNMFVFFFISGFCLELLLDSLQLYGELV